MTASEWGMVFTAVVFWVLWLHERHTHRRTQRDLKMALMLEHSERVRRQDAERALALAPALPAPPLNVTEIVFQVYGQAGAYTVTQRPAHDR